jgi:hypothetical protein
MKPAQLKTNRDGRKVLTVYYNESARDWDRAISEGRKEHGIEGILAHVIAMPGCEKGGEN